MFLDLKELGYEGAYGRVAAFGRRWKMGQRETVKSASESTHHALNDARANCYAVRNLHKTGLNAR